MACPTESTFARLQAGVLESAEVAALHRHLDECSSCLELAGILGCMQIGGTDSKVSESTAAIPKRPDWTTVAATRASDTPQTLAVMALSRLHLSLTAGWMAISESGRRPGGSPALGPLESNLPLALGIYFAVLGFGGLVACVVAIWSIASERHWSASFTRRYAIVSMLTVVLAPLGFCLLAALHRSHRSRANLVIEVSRYTDSPK